MQQRHRESEQHALAALDADMETFNAHDWPRNAATLNYPHVRLASGQVVVFETPEQFAGTGDERIARGFEAGWHRSAWDEREVIHSAPDKVHLAVRFTRYDAEGRRLASYRSLWIVTLVDGHWGIQARSSFAP